MAPPDFLRAALTEGNDVRLSSRKTACRWFQTHNRIPAEEMAAKIEAILKPIFLSGSQ